MLISECHEIVSTAKIYVRPVLPLDLGRYACQSKSVKNSLKRIVKVNSAGDKR